MTAHRARRTVISTTLELTSDEDVMLRQLSNTWGLSRVRTILKAVRVLGELTKAQQRGEVVTVGDRELMIL